MFLSQNVQDRLYRACLICPVGKIHAFVLARNAAWAIRTVRLAVSALYDIPRHATASQEMLSFDDLVVAGTSADEDLRIFEVDWRGSAVAAWVSKPLFLTDDPTVAIEWVNLQINLAGEKTFDAIRRAGKD